MKNLIIFSLLLCSACAIQDDPTFAKIEEKLADTYNSESSGIALAVVSDSALLWAHSVGMGDISRGMPMTSERVLNIASVSKVFVATAIIQLSEQGLLKLNDDVNLHLPFAVKNPVHQEEPITILQLLTHRSSIIDSDFYDSSYTSDTISISLAYWIVNYLVPGGEFYSEANFSDKTPGQEWQYSNIGFGLLALLVENIANVSFEVYCKEHIFSPLGMKNTSWNYPVQQELAATSYAYFSEEPDTAFLEYITPLLNDSSILTQTYLALHRYSFPNYPDGLLYTNIDDLIIFAKCILNNGSHSKHQLLSQASIDLMFELNGNPDDKQGLGWRYTGMGSIWGHGGDDPGVQTGLYMDRKNKLAMLMIKNSNLGSRTALMKDMYRAARNGDGD